MQRSQDLCTCQYHRRNVVCVTAVRLDPLRFAVRLDPLRFFNVIIFCIIY